MGTILTRKYRDLVKSGDHKGAAELLIEIEKRYSSLKSMQDFCERQRQILLGAHIETPETNDSSLFQHYYTESPDFKERPTRYINAIRKHGDHKWYTDQDIFDALARAWSKKGSSLMPPCGTQRITVIGHDLALNTGVLRSISHYLNFISHLGGYKITTYELSEHCDAQSINMIIQSSDLVIINSIYPLIKTGALRKEVQKISRHKPIYFYCHETEWTLSAMTDIETERLRQALPHLHGLLVSHKQVGDLSHYGRLKDYCIVRECTSRPSQLRPLISPLRSEREKGTVLMGTWQKRKGSEFFSKCADKASARKLPIKFAWAGALHDQACYRSDQIDFLGRLSQIELSKAIEKNDIFFLSSYDDPFPLAAIEAYLGGCKLLLPRQTGLTELFEGMPGTRIYESHDEDIVLDSLNELISQERQKVEDIQFIEKELGAEAFTKRLNSYFRATMPRKYIEILRKTYGGSAETYSIAVVIHLFYQDLFTEISTQLEALPGSNTDIYITVNEAIKDDEVETMHTILANRFREVSIRRVANKGLDIAPFFMVLSEILAANREYDYILKIHGKKSVLASGENTGDSWRRGLLDGLLGNKQNVSRIIGMFCQDNEIGIIAPSEYWISKSNRDKAENINENILAPIRKDYGIDNPSDFIFVRGTMFWARFKEFAEAYQNRCIPQPSDFEEGYSVDGLKAHAYERILSYIPQLRKKPLRFNSHEACDSLSHIGYTGLHCNEDIYVLCSGPSLGLIDKSFFSNKVTIGVNSVVKRIDCTYAIFKEYSSPEVELHAVQRCKSVFASLYKSGNRKQGFVISNIDVFRSSKIIFFDHQENERDKFDLSVISSSSSKVFVSWSTVTSAIHLAAIMGAKNIVLVGHDCGQINGKTHIVEYNRTDGSVDAWGGDSAAYVDWLSKIEAQTIAVREHIKSQFGTNLYSLNPFINLSLEGSKYSR